MKASGSVDLVVTIALVIVLVIMPLFSVLIEKIIVYHTINEVVGVLEGSVYFVSGLVSLEELSQTQIEYNLLYIENLFEQNFKELVSESVDICDMKYVHKGEISPYSHKKTLRDTICVTMDIEYVHKVYPRLLKKSPIKFKYALELPQNI